MALFRNLSLLTRITLIVTAILLAFFALSALLNYRQHKSYIVGEAVEKARIIAAEAIRTREYLSQQLLEGEIPLSVVRYGLIPVVASTRIGAWVGEDVGYRIRQTSDRYRNPQNAPDAFEAELLGRFKADPSLTEDYAVTEIDGEPVFRYLQAFKADASCLECHGDPAQAPAFLRELFPPESDQAYDYRLGEVIGAASVTIPMSRIEEQILAIMRYDLVATGGIFLAMITCLGLLNRMAVTNPLQRLARGISDIVRTGRFEKKIPRRGEDEIGVLIDGFNEMMQQLQENTRYLEESEKRLTALTETARDGIVSFLGNGQIILFNRQAERIFGYSKREVLGVSIAKLLHEECAELHRLGPEAYLQQEGARLMASLQVISGCSRDGSLLPLELSLSVAESDGHPFYTAILRERGAA